MLTLFIFYYKIVLMTSLESKLSSGRMVSIDIEPGGATRRGVIGLSEIIDDQIGDSCYLPFTSPLGRRLPVLSPEEEAEHTAALEAYYGGPENVPRPRGSNLPGFEVTWPYVDAFIGDSVVTAYGHGYDMGALRKLTAAIDIPLPDYYFIDGKTALRRHLGRSPGCLQGVAIEHLLDPEEVQRRKNIAYSGEKECNKWLLHTAADDAEMNARVFTDIIFPERRVKLSGLLGSLGMKAFSLSQGKPVKR